MTIQRYGRTPIIKFGEKYGTSEAIPTIRNNINNGNIRKKIYICEENVRLDILAGQEYGDAKLWWILAAASGIGWGLQVPPGTFIIIPKLEDIIKFVG